MISCFCMFVLLVLLLVLLKGNLKMIFSQKNDEPQIYLLHTTTSNIWCFLPFHLCSGNGGNFTGMWCPADLGPPMSLHAVVAALALVFAVIWAKQRRAAECLSTTLPVKLGEHGTVGLPIPDWIWWGDVYLSNPDLPLPGVNILLQPLALDPGL